MSKMLENRQVEEPTNHCHEHNPRSSTGEILSLLVWKVVVDDLLKELTTKVYRGKYEDTEIGLQKLLETGPVGRI